MGRKAHHALIRMSDSPIRATFRKPFSEQVAAFRLRLGDLVPTARWDDLRGNEHDRAFMVAGAVKADLLADLGVAVEKAISEGTTFETFQKDFRGIVERHGWHGWTGEGTAKGEAWRMRVIYRTNLATSYAAGRLAQLREGKFRYWVYRHGGSLEPRPHHLSWDGVGLPPDHPFWATHYPPNGWGCSCTVHGARTEAGIRRVGGDPDKALPDNWRARDAKTGAPAGIDKGWDHAPGASVSDEIRAFAAKPVAWPHQIGKAFFGDLPKDRADPLVIAFRQTASLEDELRRYSERVMGERGGMPISKRVAVEPMRTLGLATQREVDTVRKLTGRDVAGSDWTLDASAVRHAMARHSSAGVEVSRGQIPLGPSDFGRLGWLLAAPDKVERAEDSPTGLPVLRVSRETSSARLVALFEIRRGRMALVTMWLEKIVPGPRP